MSSDSPRPEPQVPFRVGGRNQNVDTFSRELQQAGKAQWAVDLKDQKWFAATVLLILLHAIWAAHYSGTELAPIAVPIRADGGAAIDQAELALTPEMSPVLIEIRTQRRGENPLQYSYELVAPNGGVVVKHQGASNSMSVASGSRKEKIWTQKARVTRVEVREAGRYRLRATVAPPPVGLKSAQILLRRNASESHFFRNLGMLVVLYLGMRKWRNRKNPSPEEPPSSSTAPAHGEFIEPRPAGDRWGQRLVLEGMALVISIVRTPLVGFYTAWIVIAFALGLGPRGGWRWETAKAAFEWATASDYIAWIIPQGEFHGWDAAWALGCAGGAVTFAIYLVTLPVRWLLPPRPPLTFRARARRLFYLHLGMVAAAALWWWGQPIPGADTYEEMIIAFGALSVTVLYVPALILAQITAMIEAAIEKRQLPDNPIRGWGWWKKV